MARVFAPRGANDRRVLERLTDVFASHAVLRAQLAFDGERAQDQPEVDLHVAMVEWKPVALSSEGGAPGCPGWRRPVKG